MDYLGQHVELSCQAPGWVGVWWHPAGIVQVGFFPTANDAWEAVTEIIQRDFAVRSLLEVVTEWRDIDLIDEWEHLSGVNSLVEFVLA
jgi:hypothetical protein